MNDRRTEDARLLGGLIAGGAVLLLGLLMSVLLAVPARAHAGLLHAVPASGATVPAPDQVVLSFSGDLAPSLVTVVLQGPTGRVDLPGGPVVAGQRLVQALGPLPAGEHVLRYRVVTDDGHPVTGETSFTVSRPITAPTDPAVPAAGAAATGGPAGSGAADPHAGTATGSTPGPAAGAATGAVALLVLLGAGAAVLRRRPPVEAGAEEGGG